ncbi:MAG: exonuclease SbcCD subunit D [Eubacteriales bacterium]|nr:exonuclease SbcCD subunit D [Eubacteriales bacterium]
MKLMHLSDLHLGKRLNEFSLHEDQAYILHQIIQITREEQPDGILIAGDLYDKPVPPAEAVGLLDRFLSDLAATGAQVFVISGNHDSAERLSFGSGLMQYSGVHIAPVYHGEVRPFTLTDAYGPVDVYLLPFIKPVHVRACFHDEEIASCTDALACAIRHMNVDPTRRNVLVTHQFVTGGVRCESEEVNVGGADNVNAEVFASFDYVALGHLHGAQQIGERIRYCGTPLKYSFSEAQQQKSVTMTELGPKGDLTLRTVSLVPLREMRELRGDYMTLTSRAYYQQQDTDAYLHLTLTDEEDVPDAAARLRVIYPNLMKLDYDNARTRASADFSSGAPEDRRSPAELFGDFYALQNGQPMSEVQRAYVLRLLERLTEEER